MNFNPGYTWKKELSLWWEVSPPYCNSGFSVHFGGKSAHPTVIQILGLQYIKINN
jgi:hypothetical protein